MDREYQKIQDGVDRKMDEFIANMAKGKLSSKKKEVKVEKKIKGTIDGEKFKQDLRKIFDEVNQ